MRRVGQDQKFVLETCYEFSQKQKNNETTFLIQQIVDEFGDEFGDEFEDEFGVLSDPYYTLAPDEFDE